MLSQLSNNAVETPRSCGVPRNSQQVVQIYRAGDHSVELREHTASTKPANVLA